MLEGPLRRCCCISPPLPLSSSLHPCRLSHGLSRSPLAALWVCLLPAAPPCTLCFTCLMTLLSSQLLFLNISQVQSLSCPKPSTSLRAKARVSMVHTRPTGSPSQLPPGLSAQPGAPPRPLACTLAVSSAWTTSPSCLCGSLPHFIQLCLRGAPSKRPFLTTIGQ